MAGVEETNASRWARTMGNANRALGDNRQSRGWTQRSEGRKEREFVDYVTRVPAGEATGGVQGPN